MYTVTLTIDCPEGTDAGSIGRAIAALTSLTPWPVKSELVQIQTRDGMDAGWADVRFSTEKLGALMVIVTENSCGLDDLQAWVERIEYT
jgi:hypothetical protein